MVKRTLPTKLISLCFFLVAACGAWCQTHPSGDSPGNVQLAFSSSGSDPSDETQISKSLPDAPSSVRPSRPAESLRVFRDEGIARGPLGHRRCFLVQGNTTNYRLCKNNPARTGIRRCAHRPPNRVLGLGRITRFTPRVRGPAESEFSRQTLGKSEPKCAGPNVFNSEQICFSQEHKLIRFGRFCMTDQSNERWYQLCTLAALETDPAKLLALVAEVNRLLAKKEQLLSASQSAEMRRMWRDIARKVDQEEDVKRALTLST
jgi:hypothetical protein